MSHGTEPKLIPQDIMIQLSLVPLWWDWGEAGNGRREESWAPVASKAGTEATGQTGRGRDAEEEGGWQ